MVDYINGLTAEQRKDLRGYFGGGADTRFWRAYQKAIANARLDFTPEGLDEYWQNETKIYNDETKSMLTDIEAKIKGIISERLSDYFGDGWLKTYADKVMNEKERKITAYHEAGHAIVGHVLPDSDPVHKVTIIPRGNTGGVTWFLPPEDRSYKNIYELG